MPVSGTQPQTDITLKGAIDEYCLFVQTEGLASKTLTAYRGMLSVFATFADAHGVKQVALVTLRLVDQFRNQRSKTLKPKSMANEGAMLNRFFAWCAERQMLDRSPLEGRRFTAPAPVPRSGPTLAQINAVLDASTPSRRPVLAMLAFTGMRVGECRQLRPQDVDFKNGWVHIVSRRGAETKTRQSRRVPLHRRLRQELAAVRAGREWYFTAAPSGRYPDGQHHINDRDVLESFQVVLRRLGLPVGQEDGFVTHSLRHSFKTIAVNAGVPRDVVDAWQGHVPDRRNASNVYYALTDEVSQEQILKLPF